VANALVDVVSREDFVRKLTVQIQVARITAFALKEFASVKKAGQDKTAPLKTKPLFHVSLPALITGNSTLIRKSVTAKPSIVAMTVPLSFVT
jgi:hypothetical protein